jgi:hypothetical protein
MGVPMSDLKVGDVCIVIACGNPKGKHLIGKEVTLIGVSTWFADHFILDAKHGDLNWHAPPKCLRKKPDYDGNRTVTWDRCVWKPSRVGA